MWKQSPHIQCVAAVKSKASSNSGENERETAEFGAVRPWDPPKTQLSRNLFWKNISDTISPSPTYRGNRNWLFGFRRKFLTILIQILNEHYSWPSQYSNVKSIDQFEQPSLHQWCLGFWNRGNILDPGGVGSWEGLVSLKCPQSCSCHALEEVSWLLGSNHLRLYILLDKFIEYLYWHFIGSGKAAMQEGNSQPWLMLLSHFSAFFVTFTHFCWTLTWTRMGTVRLTRRLRRLTCSWRSNLEGGTSHSFQRGFVTFSLHRLVCSPSSLKPTINRLFIPRRLLKSSTTFLSSKSTKGDGKCKTILKALMCNCVCLCR